MAGKFVSSGKVLTKQFHGLARFINNGKELVRFDTYFREHHSESCPKRCDGSSNFLCSVHLSDTTIIAEQRRQEDLKRNQSEGKNYIFSISHGNENRISHTRPPFN
jgi:hypothetical protein